MKICESNLCFNFQEGVSVCKFDSSPYYRNYFDVFPGAKGVDFVADSSDFLLLMEVKNCRGHESDNRWRLAVDNQKVSTAPTTVDTENRDSFDVEVTKKVAMTLSCLIGAHTKAAGCKSAENLSVYYRELLQPHIRDGSKCLVVILFLEGDFHSQTRSKLMIMQRIQERIKSKLKWVNCKVRVVDSNTYRNDYFNLE